MTLFGGRKLTILFPTFNPISFSIFHLFFSLSFPFLKSLHLLFSLHIRRWKWFSTSSNISWQSNFLNTTYTISLPDRKKCNPTSCKVCVGDLKNDLMLPLNYTSSFQKDIYYCWSHFILKHFVTSCTKIIFYLNKYKRIYDIVAFSLQSKFCKLHVS